MNRPRLVALLDNCLSRPVTLVSAPAGFGKTSAVKEWWTARVEDGGASMPNAAWFSAETRDNDPQRFLAAFDSALASVSSPEKTPGAGSFHFGGRPAEDALIEIASAYCVSRCESIVLVVDDYDRITNTFVQRTVALLAERPLPKLKLVLINRGQPPSSLARARATGDLSGIDGNALRFTPNEVSQIILNRTGLNPSSAERQALAMNLEGLEDEGAQVSRSLHRRASIWFEGQGLLPEAIDHAMSARDFDRAIPLIAESARTWFVPEREAMLAQWLRALPTGTVEQYPDLMLAHATALVRCGQTEEAVRLLRALMRSDREKELSDDELLPAAPTRGVSKQPSPDPVLSRQELKVLELVAAGKSNKEIGTELSIAVATVKSHMSHLFEKLAADNRTHLVALARERSLLT